jgi:hypothetical protein
MFLNELKKLPDDVLSMEAAVDDVSYESEVSREDESNRTAGNGSEVHRNRNSRALDSVHYQNPTDPCLG